MLNQNEIDQLLKGIGTGNIESEDFMKTLDGRRVRQYNFKYKSKMLTHQLEVISQIYEKFSILAASSLSNMLHLPVEIKVTSVGEISYEKYIDSLLTPTTIITVSVSPLMGYAVMEIDRNITSTILEQQRMIDSTSDKADITKNVIEMAILILKEMIKAWSMFININFDIVQIDTNPQLFKCALPSDMFVFVNMEATVDYNYGRIKFAIPYTVIKSILSNLHGKEFINKEVNQ